MSWQKIRAALMRYRLFVMTLAISLAGGLAWAGEPGTLIFPKPGFYRDVQLISVTAGQGIRLKLYLDGEQISLSDFPLLLSVPSGEAKQFTLTLTEYPLDPSAEALRTKQFSWTIDRQRPDAPHLVLYPADGGALVGATVNEKASILYRMYHPLSGATSRGILSPDNRPFLPDGAVICVWAQDIAGNSGEVTSATTLTGCYDRQPFTVVSPVPGTWSNRQTLYLERQQGVSVVYTLDGSDPAQQGSEYTGPLIIDKTGLVTVRLAARSADGRLWEDRVLFSVTERPGLQLPFELSSTGVVSLGPFAELELPSGYTARIGDPLSSGNGQTSLLFPAMRGIYRMYPVIISDGVNAWRWMCASDGREGAVPPANTPPSESPSTSGQGPLIAIHDWHYITLNYSLPVFYSLASGGWQLYREPVLVDRRTESRFSWYAPSWKDGEVSSIQLPVKPSLEGIPAGGKTAHPVFISVSETPFDLRYTASSDFFPAEPLYSHPDIKPGLLVESPAGSASNFIIRVRSFYQGISHGDLAASFIVDRKSPRMPSFGIPDTLVYSRHPVRLKPSGEDMVQVSIRPSSWSRDGEVIVLEGDEKQPVTYTLSSFAVDSSGNQSPSLERTITVDRNALYIDAAANKGGNGSPSDPFNNLDEALSAIKGSGTWRLYLSGSAIPLQNSHTIQARVFLSSEGSTIRAAQGVSLFVFQGYLDVSGCHFTRTDQGPHNPVKPLTPQVPSFFEVTNGELRFTDSSIRLSAVDSCTLVRSNRSQLSITSTVLDIVSTDHALGLESIASTLAVSKSGITASGRTAVGSSVSGGRVRFHESSITVSPVSAGRAIESWGSSVVIQNLSLVRGKTVASDGGNRKNRDVGLWFDKRTVFVSEQGLSVRGFATERLGSSK